MSSEPSGSIVFDTGVLVELAVDSTIANDTRNRILGGEIRPVTGELNVVELSYLLCRKAGRENANRSVTYLRKTGQFRILPSSSFLDLAARMKCERSISLVDCVTICIGESLEIPVLFANREREIQLEMRKRPFKTRFFFLNGRA
ncbi:MAG: PIN domain-containing protein [Nitrososphaerales archaeon]